MRLSATVPFTGGLRPHGELSRCADLGGSGKEEVSGGGCAHGGGVAGREGAYYTPVVVRELTLQIFKFSFYFF